MFRSHAAAALAAVLLAAPVVAQDVVVGPNAPVTLVAWAKRVGKDLDRNMRFPTSIGFQARPTGIVRVKFACSESGRTDQVALYKSSGDRALDLAALESVRRVTSLHPLPDGMGHGQRYVATLLYATNYDDYDQQLRKIRAEALKNNSWFKGSSGIALLPVPSGAAN